MPTIDIVVPRTVYSPGEDVIGEVVISSDDTFEFTEMYIEMVCREHTKITVHTGETSYTYREEFIHHHERIALMEPGIFSGQSTRIPFRFTIPPTLPPSYDGFRGWIETKLKAKIGRKWRIDPRKELDLVIQSTRRTPEPVPVTGCISDDESVLLDFEIRNTHICLGEDIEVVFRLDDLANIRGVRFELVSEEHVRARGRKREHTRKHGTLFAQEKGIPRRNWMSITIPTSHNIPQTYRGPLVDHKAYLKIVLDIPWRFDKDAVIPLELIGNCKLLMNYGKSLNGSNDQCQRIT